MTRQPNQRGELVAVVQMIPHGQAWERHGAGWVVVDDLQGVCHHGFHSVLMEKRDEGE